MIAVDLRYVNGRRYGGCRGRRRVHPDPVPASPGMSDFRPAGLLVGLAGSVLACSTEPGACTTSVEPGIVVEIRDSVTGAPVAAHVRTVRLEARLQPG